MKHEQKAILTCAEVRQAIMDYLKAKGVEASPHLIKLFVDHLDKDEQKLALEGACVFWSIEK